MDASKICLVLACLCFVALGFNVKTPRGDINFLGFGLAFVVLSMIL